MIEEQNALSSRLRDTMAPKKNIFTPCVSTLLREFSDLRHVSHMASSTIKDAVKHREESIASVKAAGKPRPKYGVVSLSTRFSMPDLRADRPYMESLWVKDRESADETLISILQETGQRLHAQVLCEVFEASELHFQEVGANFYFQARNDIGRLRSRPKVDRKAFNKSIEGQKKKLHEGTLDYFRAYARRASRDGCDWLLKELVQCLPFFEDETFTKRLKTASDFYRGIQFTRNKIVHAFGTYEVEELSPFSAKTKELITKMTRPSHLRGTAALLPSDYQVDKCLELVGGLACFVYSALSDAFGMANELPDVLAL